MSRSSIALHKRAFGNTYGYSENGRFVVMMTAVLLVPPSSRIPGSLIS